MANVSALQWAQRGFFCIEDTAYTPSSTFIISADATLIYWSLSRVIQNFQKARWVMSVISITRFLLRFELSFGMSTDN